jgi:hypothetical protein
MSQEGELERMKTLLRNIKSKNIQLHTDLINQINASGAIIRVLISKQPQTQNTKTNN